MTQPIDKNAPPSAAEYGQRRAYWARAGVSQAQFSALFGKQGNPKNRGVAATDAATWAHGLPKAAQHVRAAMLDIPAADAEPAVVAPAAPVAPVVNLLGRAVPLYDPTFPPTALVMRGVDWLKGKIGL